VDRASVARPGASDAGSDRLTRPLAVGLRPTSDELVCDAAAVFQLHDSYPLAWAHHSTCGRRYGTVRYVSLASASESAVERRALFSFSPMDSDPFCLTILPSDLYFESLGHTNGTRDLRYTCTAPLRASISGREGRTPVASPEGRNSADPFVLSVVDLYIEAMVTEPSVTIRKNTQELSREYKQKTTFMHIRLCFWLCRVRASAECTSRKSRDLIAG
jgi:hypothetical protein